MLFCAGRGGGRMGEYGGGEYGGGRGGCEFMRLCNLTGS